MRSPERELPLRHAIALGLLQGPTELLPISSSAHTALLARFAGWPYARMDSQRRKSFEVALHAGAGVALAVHMRHQLLHDVSELNAGRAAAVALSLAPPALAGYALERPIEQRLGGSRSLAFGLLAGALAMAWADRRTGTSPRARPSGDGPAQGERTVEEVNARDGLALGLAQASALIPGVSRNGATLAAARARGFSRAAAQSLSWHAGLPVLFGAGGLKATHIRRAGLAPGEGVALVAGGLSALLSTLAGARALAGVLRDGRPLLPYAIYRCVLALVVLTRSQ